MNKKEMNKQELLLRMINRSNSELENISSELVKQNRLKDIALQQERMLADREFLVKDRVDISLKEYIEMKAELEKSREKLVRYEDLFEKFCIAKFLPFICDGEEIQVETVHLPQYFKDMVMIKFRINQMLGGK